MFPFFLIFIFSLYGNGQVMISARDQIRAQHGVLLRAMTLLLCLQLVSEICFSIKHIYLSEVSVREVASQIRHAPPSLLWNLFWFSFICDAVFMCIYYFFGFRAYSVTHSPSDFDTFSKVALVGIILESMFAYQSRDSVPNILIVVLRGIHFFIARYLGLLAAVLVHYGVSESNIFIMDDDELMQQVRSDQLVNQGVASGGNSSLAGMSTAVPSVDDIAIFDPTLSTSPDQQPAAISPRSYYASGPYGSLSSNNA